MERIEKTVFISYRRTNFPWALAIFQSLTQCGYDVFFDYTGIASGDFERAIAENIRSRAHFLVLLTRSALERCGEEGDWLRREIETALNARRNIVPITLDGFDFTTPAIAARLTGKLEALRRYAALSAPPDYFWEAMDRLRSRFLNVPLSAVLHPTSPTAERAAEEQQALAGTAPAVREEELAAQRWFERGFDARDPDEKIRFYSLAIGLRPGYAEALYNRGVARSADDDVAGALADYDEVIRLRPADADAFYNRSILRRATGDSHGAWRDFDEAIRLGYEPGNSLAKSGMRLLSEKSLQGFRRLERHMRE